MFNNAIQYLTKNSKGRSIDTLTQEDFKSKRTVKLWKDCSKKNPNYLALGYLNTYFCNIHLEGKNLSLNEMSIVVMRDKIKKGLKKMGFKDLSPDVITQDSNLDIEDPITNFWIAVNHMNWGGDNNYQRIQEELEKGKYGNKKDIIKLRNTYRALYDTIDSEYWKQYNNPGEVKPLYSEYLWDDGISDYLADVIGLGEKNYKRLLSPKAIKEKLLYKESTNCTESFAYVFNNID